MAFVANDLGGPGSMSDEANNRRRIEFSGILGRDVSKANLWQIRCQGEVSGSSLEGDTD